MIFRVIQFVLLCGLCASYLVDIGTTGECNQYQKAEQERLYVTLLVEELRESKSMFEGLKNISEQDSDSVIMRDIDNTVAQLTTLISSYSAPWDEGLPFLVDTAGWAGYYPDICLFLIEEVYSFREQNYFLDEVLNSLSSSYQRLYDCLMSKTISECQDNNTPKFVLSVSHDYDTNGSPIDGVSEFRQLYKQFFDGIYKAHPYFDTILMYAHWFRAVKLTGRDWGKQVEDQLFRGLLELFDVFDDVVSSFFDIKKDFVFLRSMVGAVYARRADVSELLEYTEIVKIRIPQLDELSTFTQNLVSTYRTMAQTVRANKPDGITFLSATRTNVEGDKFYDLRKRISTCLVKVGELIEYTSSQMAKIKSAVNDVTNSQMTLLMPWEPILQNYFAFNESIMSYLVCAKATLGPSRVFSLLYKRESQWNTNFDLLLEDDVLNSYLTNTENMLSKIEEFLKLITFNAFKETFSNGGQASDPVLTGSAPTSRETTSFKNLSHLLFDNTKIEKIINMITLSFNKVVLTNGGQASDSVFTGSLPASAETTAFKNLSDLLLNNFDSFLDNQCKLHKSILYSQLIIELEPKSKSELSGVSEHNLSDSVLYDWNEIFDDDEIVNEAIDTSSITDATLIGLMDASKTSLTLHVVEVADKFDKVTALIDDAYTVYTTEVDRFTKLSALVSKQASLDTDISTLESDLNGLYILPCYVGPIAMKEFEIHFPWYAVVDVDVEGTEWVTNDPISSFLDYGESMDGLFGSLMPDDVLTAVTNLDSVSRYSDNLDGASVFSFTDKNTNTEAYLFMWDLCEFVCSYEITFREIDARLALGFGARKMDSGEVHLQRGVFVETVPIMEYELRSIIHLNVVEETFLLYHTFDRREADYTLIDHQSFRVLNKYRPVVAISGSASMTLKRLDAAVVGSSSYIEDDPLYYRNQIIQRTSTSDKVVHLRKVTPVFENDVKKWFKLQSSQSACISLGAASKSDWGTLLFGFFFDGMSVVFNPSLTCLFSPIIKSIPMRGDDKLDTSGDMGYDMKNQVMYKTMMRDEVTREVYMSYKLKEVKVCGERKFNIQLEFFSKHMNHVWNLNTIVDHEFVPSFIYEKDKSLDLISDIEITEMVQAPAVPTESKYLCQSHTDCGGERSCIFEKVCRQTGLWCQWNSHCGSGEDCASTKEWKLGRCKLHSAWSDMMSFFNFVFLYISRTCSRWFGLQ